MVAYQDIMTSSIGEFGRSQLYIVLACKGPGFFAAWGMIMMSFAGAQPKWWSISVTQGNLTERFQLCLDRTVNNTIVFDKSIFTIVSEWNLICDRDWIPTVITTVQMVGVLIGAAVVGQLGDLIGRKKCMILVYTTNLVFILVQGLSINWQMMTVAVFFVGFGLGGYLCVSIVFMLEFISTKYRTFISLIPMWALGVMCFGGMFKLLPNWRHLCFANAALGFPFLIAILLTPESVRWLFTQGRLEEGKEILKKMAQRNGRAPPNLENLGASLQDDFERQQKEKHTYFSLFFYPSVRRKALIFSVIWFVVTFSYYGLTLGVSQLAGDISLNMTIMGIGEVVCMFFIWLLSKCFGRRNTTVLLLGGMSVTSFGITVAYYANRPNYNSIKSGLALTSRFFLSAAWSSAIIFTVESFPTEIRTIGYGFASVAGRIGGIVAPQNKMLSKLSNHLPFTVNGVLALISIFCCLLLKDTYNEDLPDKIEEKVNTLKINLATAPETSINEKKVKPC